MARIPLAGSSYSLASLAAAAQESLNIYPEAIENKEESAKGKAILRGAPGYQLAKALTTIDAAATPVRGLWSGGGRLFVVAGTKYMEIDESYALVGSVYTVLDDSNHAPVQMFGNGNQLLIVSAGQAYCDNGAGPVACRFQLNGTVSAVGTAITWQSGDQFTAAMQGREVTINGHEFLVSLFTDATHITISSGLGTGAGTVSTVSWTRAEGAQHGGQQFTQLPQTQVFWQSGDQFTSAIEGLPITINGVDYTVQSVTSSKTLLLTTAEAGNQVGVAYSTILTQLAYSSDGGDLVTAVTGAYLDGSAYVQRPSGGTPDLGRQVNFSDVNDFTAWRGLNFKDKEGAPDYIQSILVDSEIIYVFGTETSEAWQNDPTTGVPARIPGAMVKYGSVARYAPVAFAGKVYFLGGDSQGGTVAYRIDGSTPTRISTHAVEEAWRASGAFPTEAVGFGYLEDGHLFWVLNFAGNTNAWVYDETASRDLGEPTWHQRATWDSSGSQFLPYRPWFHTFIPEWGSVGRHIVGDYLNGNLYELSSTFYDANGSNIKWRRALPYIYSDGSLIYCGRFELEMDAGEVTSGPAPTIDFDYSDDRGQTFSTPQTASVGVHADYSARVIWPFPTGSTRGRVMRLAGAGQYKVCLIAAMLETEMGI